jgi:hypothetical protein
MRSVLIMTTQGVHVCINPWPLIFSTVTVNFINMDYSLVLLFVINSVDYIQFI